MVKGCWFGLGVFLIIIGHDVVTGHNEGLRLAITTKGFDYVNSIAQPILHDTLRYLKIPDISHNEEPINYRISGIGISYLNMSSSSIKTNVTGVTLEGMGIDIHAFAHWHLEEHDWPHITDSGSMKIYITNALLQTTVLVVMDTSGKPSIKPISCSFRMSQFDVKLHGDSSQIFNSGKIHDLIDHSLRSKMEEQACDSMFKTIISDISSALKTIPFDTVFDNKYELSYVLVADPLFNTTYVETRNKGEFFLKSDIVDAPFDATPLPSVSTVSMDRMMYIWVTEYVANTAGLVFQRGGSLQYKITPDLVPSDSPFQLNTTDFKYIVPALYNKYPNMPMMIYVNSTRSPWVQVSKDAVNITITGVINVGVQLRNKTVVSAFNISTTVYADLYVWIRQVNSKPVLSANCSEERTKFTLKLLSSSIGNFDPSTLNDCFKLLVEAFIIPLINSYGKTGLVIPVVDGLSFVKPKIILEKEFVLIETDFNYKLKN